MTSQRRIDANRANSKKSTGPRTDEGKHKSSANARKHGFTAKVHVGSSPEEHEAMQARYREWHAWLVVDGNPVAADLCALAVRSYHIVDKILDADDAASAERVRHAEIHWDEAQAERVAALVEGMADDPMTHVAKLRGSVAGCGWLLDSWKALQESLANQCWNEHCHKRARKLLGYDNEDPKLSLIVPDVWQEHLGRYMEAYRMRDKPIAFMQWHLRVMRVENIEKALEHDQAVFQRLYDKALPFDQKYTDLIDRTIAELERRCGELVEIEAADRRAARALAAVDCSDLGKLRHRYRLENQRELHKSLDQIEKLNTITRKHGRPEAFEELEAAESAAETSAEASASEPKSTDRAAESGASAEAVAESGAIERHARGESARSSVESPPASRNEPNAGRSTRHESGRLRTDPTRLAPVDDGSDRLDRV